MWDCERGAQSTRQWGSLAESGRLAEGSYMLSSVGYSQFAVVAWARDELGGESFTGSSQGETAATIGFPSIENGGEGLTVIVRSMEGVGCGGDEHRASSSSAAVLMTLGEEMSLIVVIPHVNNGGCMKEGGDLGPEASGRDQCWIQEGVAAAGLIIMCGRLAPMSMRGVQGRGWGDGAGIRGNGWWESLSSSSYSITLVVTVSCGRHM
ncbi:hypothetical protein ARMSODRAFT_973853 [Armillaria solidipes]|uniref:Uncharacterized protein n=1 Tax=Armillaria solidipes TaxID=1076256 RepID=A0A2H3C3Q8_9AGAR|nr:hypothetical protein ARMSODRAFT_973853 [Armillaria solidipes]